MYFWILFLRKPSARIKISRNFGSAAPGRALASTWQNQLPVRDCQKRCIAETLVKLSGTSFQNNESKSKEPPWECLNPRNYRAVASRTTRRDLADPPPSVREPCAFRSAKHYACYGFGDRGSGHPSIGQSHIYLSNIAILAG